MPQRVQRLRHPTAQADAFIGVLGEITIDTTKKTIRVHDGEKSGGFETVLTDASNMQSATPAQDGKMTKEQVQQLDAQTSDISDLKISNDGVATVTLTGAGPITLTEAQAKNRIIKFLGDPTGSPFRVFLPEIFSTYVIINGSTKAVRVSGPAGASHDIFAGTFAQIFMGPNPENTFLHVLQPLSRAASIKYDAGAGIPGNNTNVQLALDSLWGDLNPRMDAVETASGQNASDIADLQADKMDKAANLSDVTNTRTARINLRVNSSPIGAIQAWPINTIPVDDWIICDGSTIGPNASTANYKKDQLLEAYTYLWNNFSDTECPVTGGRGASPAADWAALKPMGMPDFRNVMMFGAGDLAIQSRGGNSEITQTEAQMPPHQHTVPGGGTRSNSTGYRTSAAQDSMAAQITGVTGDGDPMNIMNPYFAINWIMCVGYVTNLVKT